MAQKKTEVGTCTACGTTVYEYVGPVDARSHPQMALKIKARKGRDEIVLCATCRYNLRIVAGVLGHVVTEHAWLTRPAEEPET